MSSSHPARDANDEQALRERAEHDASNGRRESRRARRDRGLAPSSPQTTNDQTKEEPNLRSYIAIVLESWGLVVTILLLGLALGVAYYGIKAPVFQSDGLVQVEQKNKGIAGLEDLTDVMETPAVADTEVEIIRSRMLLGSVVDELALDIVAEPRRFPVLGKAIARWRRATSPASPLLGQPRYAWGGESIAVSRLDVPPSMLGSDLTLIAKADSHYEVRDKDGTTLLATGVVGEPSVPNANSGVNIEISQLAARPSTEFVVKRRFRLAAIEELRDKITILEKGKKTGVIQLTLEGEDANLVARVIDSAERLYVRQNIERKSAEAENQLLFIEKQLPDLKSRLELAETTLSVYRTKAGTVDLTIEAQAALQQASDVEKELTLLKLQLDEVRGRFTEDHPALHALREKIGRLERQRGGVEAHFKSLPGTELESARLLRDVKVSTELYMLLVNKAEELKILKSGTIGSVRIVDSASHPNLPIAPAFTNTLLFALIGGLVTGIGAAFVKRAMALGVEDPDEIEAVIGIPVYASVPHSKDQPLSPKKLKRGKASATSQILAMARPNDLAIEAVRSMRTSLQFALGEARNNVIAITGPSPGIGKSFIALNLAHVLADAGTRVLLIDADLRKGKLHEHFPDLQRDDGLANALEDPTDFQRFIRSTTLDTLDFMPTGTLPLNPSKILASRSFEDFVSWAASHYDIVLLDTAPILAVTDAALAARTAGTTLLVLRSGQHALREIKAAVKRFAHANIDVDAIVLNDVVARGGYGNYKYGNTYHYNYDYR